MCNVFLSVCVQSNDALTNVRGLGGISSIGGYLDVGVSVVLKEKLCDVSCDGRLYVCA